MCEFTKGGWEWDVGVSALGGRIVYGCGEFEEWGGFDVELRLGGYFVLFVVGGFGRGCV